METKWMVETFCPISMETPVLPVPGICNWYQGSAALGTAQVSSERGAPKSLYEQTGKSMERREFEANSEIIYHILYLTLHTKQAPTLDSIKKHLDTYLAGVL